MPRPLLIPAALVMFAAGIAGATACTDRAGTDHAVADSLPGVAGATPDTLSAAAADGVTTVTAADSGCAPAPLADSAAGPVRLGMAVEELRTRCAGTRDSTGLAEEGLAARTLLVPVGADTVAARIVD